MISSIVAPASKFSKTSETGMRVFLNTHAPLTLPGMLSTAEHFDQSRAAMFLPSFSLELIYSASPELRPTSRSSLEKRFRSSNHIDVIHRPRPEERALARVLKDGHKQDRARGHPSRRPRKERGLLRM